MANRRGLGESRKYANGTIHENASGKFMIKDRFMDDDGVIMLEIEWLSGDKVGQIETNKEVNISASIHKFNVSRSGGSNPHLPSQNVDREKDDVPLIDKIDMIYQLQQGNREFVEGFFTRLSEIHDTMQKQQETITQLTGQIQRMIDYGQLLNKAQDAFIKQQEALNKLIEKI